MAQPTTASTRIAGGSSIGIRPRALHQGPYARIPRERDGRVAGSGVPERRERESTPAKLFGGRWPCARGLGLSPSP
jgi:hypothetical protein